MIKSLPQRKGWEAPPHGHLLDGVIQSLFGRCDILFIILVECVQNVQNFDAEVASVEHVQSSDTKLNMHRL